MNAINEQLLTAYALDELSSELRADVEAYLAAHPDAAAEVDAIRVTAGQLRDELMVELQSTPPAEVRPPLRIRPRWQMPMALAASVAVVAGTFAVLIQSTATQPSPVALKLASQDAQSSPVESNEKILQQARNGYAQPAEEQIARQESKFGNAGPVGQQTDATAAGARKLADSMRSGEMARAAAPLFKDAPNFNLNSTAGSGGKGSGGGGEGSGGLFGQSVAGGGVRATGPSRDANHRLGASLDERRSPLDRDAIVAGNVTAGREFRGRTETKDARNFRGPASDASAGRFQPSSAIVPASPAAPQVGRVQQPPLQVTPVYRGDIAHNTETYDRITDNAFLDAVGNPLSTFSIDVDTASYSNVRRFLTAGQLPPKDAVRIEELVNYFPYSYDGPKDAEKPFAASVEIAACPWNQQNRLVRIGIKGREMAAEKRPASNLVFLIDVSGSMQDANKLPLVKQSLRELVNKLDSRDRVAMVVYAGSSGLVLESTAVGGFSDQDAKELWQSKYEKAGDEERTIRFANEVAALKEQRSSGRQKILTAIDRLEAGGSTNGGAGIELAYLTAQSAFIKDGVNRVILATDGDFNVGVTDQGSLTRMIEEKAKGGVFLSVLGFGMGNTKDSTMEKLADKGNGNYAYIDTPAEARKVLVEQMSGTLVTIAKDVKIQVEFNPAKVQSYRLIGYENRLLAKEDFNDDKKDAGEIGAGHTVTALYEVVPVGVATTTQPSVDALKYQAKPAMNDNPETLTLKLRYKAPDAPLEQGTSKLLEFPITDAGKGYPAASEDFKFAAAVAGFGMILRESPHKGTATLAGVAELAAEGKGPDANGYRAEFIELVKKAAAISGK